ncbi:MAG: riboflavin biosynthesis protein RibF [Pseudoflavonifractor sp.]|nr:riboflavin biosynthesis protein RibF [Alloprevotella sp.]MCM1117668.1 riboflavin biosynthesis protein RibF [Pseudoflavonifractor sp.]
MILTKGNTKRRRIAAVGMYDGVHRGHCFLLDYLRLEATQRELTPTAVTFRNHPLTVVRPSDAPPLICSPEEKMTLMEEAGADDIVVLDFDTKMRRMTAHRFLSMLHKRWAIDALVVGFNNRFGKDRIDGIEQYRAIGTEIGMDIIEAPEYKGTAAPVSSSIIRGLLADGKIEEADNALGRPFTLTGTVVDGRHLGRTLGFPTANIEPDHDNAMIPAPGVYATIAILPTGERIPSVVNIGHRPTVEDDPANAPQTIEAHIIDWTGYLYGATLKLQFISRLRDEKKFPSIDALRRALASDRRRALSTLRRRGLWE